MKHLFSFTSVLLVLLGLASECTKAASFAEFDEKANSGEQLSVVFFGSSLTFGTNASDPQLTSYRALIAKKLEETYPQARFKFWDASLGGTNSLLGVFRLERDVLRRKPDLVFLDFSANDDLATDDPETLASYEALVRQIIAEGKAPVIQVILPFQWDATGKLEKLKGRQAHLAIAAAYNTAVGDAVVLCHQQVTMGKVKISHLWPFDRVHPGDAGYAVFADAVWQGIDEAIKKRQVCAVPKKMLFGDAYLKTSRVQLSKLSKLPEGWHRNHPLRSSASFDMLMSRWLDDVAVASNRKVVSDGNGKLKSIAQKVDSLQVQFRARSVLLFGESTEKSSKYKVYLDGKLIERDAGKKGRLKEFDASLLAYLLRGNTHLVHAIAHGLDTEKNHTLVVEPVFSSKMIDQELRLESVCVAGGDAKVLLAADKK